MPPSTSSPAAVFLDASELVVSTLLNVAQLTPVPYLQNAAGLALSLLDIIQSVKSNQDAFRQLGEDACQLLYFILRNDSRAAQTIATLPSAFLKDTKELYETLKDIYNSAKARTSRNKVFRVIQYKSDSTMIQQYRDRLKHSLDVFHFKSIVSMHHSLASIQGQLAGIAAQTDRIPLDWPGKDTNMGQQHEGFLDINESGAHSEIEEKSDLERVEHESPERERFEIQTIERERETFERKGDGKNREKEQIIEKARIEKDVLMQEQDQHGRNARGGSVPEYGLQVESELPQTAYGRSHHRPSTTHTNPFRQSAPPMLSPLDNPFSSGNPIYPLHGCSATLGFPTPLPGPTMPGLSCSLLDPYIQTGTSATLYRSNYLISDIAGASGNVTYVNSVVNSKSGNVTVKNISNSKNNSSIRL